MIILPSALLVGEWHACNLISPREDRHVRVFADTDVAGSMLHRAWRGFALVASEMV